MGTVLVTGGSRGIGRGICQAFLEKGYNVAFTCRSLENLNIGLGKLNQYAVNSKVDGILCDSGIYSDVKKTIEKVIEEFNGIDILVNNAGVRKYGSVFDLSVEEWMESVNTNINGYFFFCKEVLPHLLKSSNPWIFNIGSTAGRVPFAGGIAYNTTKSAVYGFSDSLQLDVRNKGIRVCNICPGNVFNKEFECPNEEDWQMKPENIGHTITSLINISNRAMPSLLEIRPTIIPEHPEKGIRSLRYI
jgi:3-oxoacyl-[acyl-carrier protein] reductase